MDANEIMAMLPERPRDGMVKAIMKEHKDQFGGGFLIYHREALVEETVPLKDEMDPEDWDTYHNGYRHFWGAVCACTECGETWLTGWAKDGKISVSEGPDGTLYENYNNDDEGVPPDSELTTVYFQEGDTIACPRCGKDVTLIRRTRIRNRMSGSTRRFSSGWCPAPCFRTAWTEETQIPARRWSLTVTESRCSSHAPVTPTAV